MARKQIFLSLFLFLFFFSPWVVNADNFPSRTIRIVVPFAPGGGTDIVSRAIAQKIGEYFKQSCVVDNRPGANGNIGMEIVAKSIPDGYTLLITSSALAINPSIYKNIGFDPLRDFMPITLATMIPFILVTHVNLPVTNVKQIISLAKARPNELVYSSAGTGNATHLSMALFEMMAKIKMTHVPYKGTGQALADAMGGHVQLMFGAIPSTMVGIKAKKLKVIAISSAKRSSVLPEIPTVSEEGLSGYELISWYGALAPARTPDILVSQLNREMVHALRAIEVKTRLTQEGADPVANTPEQFQEYLKRDIQKYSSIVSALNIQPEK